MRINPKYSIPIIWDNIVIFIINLYVLILGLYLKAVYI